VPRTHNEKHRYVWIELRDALQIELAPVKGDGRLSRHSLRHGYASLPIAKRLDVVFVPRRVRNTGSFDPLRGHADGNMARVVHGRLRCEVALRALRYNGSCIRATPMPDGHCSDLGRWDRTGRAMCAIVDVL
jgi:integrase